MAEYELAQAIEAEESVLGAMLMSPKAGDKAVTRLTSDCFFLERNGLTFQVMATMLANGIPTDPVTVAEALKREGITEETGGRVRLHELVAMTMATANIDHYIKIVRDAWKTRLVQKKLSEIGTHLEGMSGDEAVAALDTASLEIEQMVDEKHDLVVDIKDLVSAKRLQMSNPESAKPGVPSPFTFLPDLVGGRTYILSGYMKDGKSRLGLQFGEAAASAGEKVGFASAEMSKQDLFDAWACQRTGLPHWKVSHPWRLDPNEQNILEQSMAEMESWHVDVIDDETLDPAKLRRYQRAGKYDFLIVDHLHQMSWRDRHHLDEGVKAINRIAREYEIPLLLLAQMNRSQDSQNPYPPPTMNRLKESSTIEAIAACVWFVYRERDDHNLQTDQAQFITAANRYGRVGVEVVRFDDATQSFREQKDWEAVDPVVVNKGLVAF